jgi:hypothetical protein
MGDPDPQHCLPYYDRSKKSPSKEWLYLPGLFLAKQAVTNKTWLPYIHAHVAQLRAKKQLINSFIAQLAWKMQLIKIIICCRATNSL